jgi:hypothetical protein
MACRVLRLAQKTAARQRELCQKGDGSSNASVRLKPAAHAGYRFGVWCGAVEMFFPVSRNATMSEQMLGEDVTGGYCPCGISATQMACQP